MFPPMNKVFSICSHGVFKIVDIFLKPITTYPAFFLNVIILMIIPSLLNAYFFNPEAYLHYTSTRLLGFFAKDGMSFPFILFFPTIISYLLCGLLLLVKCYVRRLLYVSKLFIYICLLVLYVTNIFLLFNFGTIISPNIILLLEETSRNESSDFISNYAFSQQSIWAYLVSLFSLLIIFFIERRKSLLSFITNQKYISFFIFIFFCYVGNRICSPAKSFIGLFDCKKVSDVEIWCMNFPANCNTLTNVIYSFYTNHISHEEIEESKKSSMADLGNVFSDSSANIILVIGESFNKHHSNLYGYEKNTNPFLLQEMKKENLYVFRDVISSYNSTSYVMKNMFSTNSIMDNEKWFSCPIFPAIFKKAGFNVYFWDNQKVTNADASDFSIFSYLYDKKISQLSYTQCNKEVYTYDMELIKSFFNGQKLFGEEKTFVIFHLIGQHCPAQTKYPNISKYLYFTSDSVYGNYTEIQKQQIASYDNATRYNDDVMRYLISQVEDKECVIVYLSDHGEEVHDFRNLYGRSHESIKTLNILKYQYEIPFMIWCSEQYKEKHPAKIENIKKSLGKPFMNDNTCQILFDLADVHSNYYKQERNLISPFYRPKPYRFVQNSVNYEDMKNGNKK